MNIRTFRRWSPLLLAAAVILRANAGDEMNTEHSGIVDILDSPAANLERAIYENSENSQVVAGAPAHYDFRDDYLSADGKFYVGYSDHSTATIELKNWPIDEFMYFIEGQVELTDENGKSTIYGPGDMLVMPKGYNGTWRQLEPVKKINIMYEGDK